MSTTTVTRSRCVSSLSALSALSATGHHHWHGSRIWAVDGAPAPAQDPFDLVPVVGRAGGTGVATHQRSPPRMDMKGLLVQACLAPRLVSRDPARVRSRPDHQPVPQPTGR